MQRSEDDTGQPFEAVTRHIVMQRDMNPYNHVFGGVMLAWLDEAAGLYVREAIGYADFVTVGMDEVNFIAPAHLGDHIVILCRVHHTGRSSITIQTRAVARSARAADDREIITCLLSFVCLKDEKPYAYFETEDYRQWRAEKNELCGIEPHQRAGTSK